MRHQNTVLHDLLKHLPWAVFDALVETHQADKHVRGLTTKSQLVALLYGQLSGAASLRALVVDLESHANRLYHLGATPVRRSSLSDANALRPSAVFSELFDEMVARAHAGLRRKLGDSVYLLDASSLRLSQGSADWARYSAKVCGAKMHVIYDADAERPIYAAVTPSRVNDITAAKAMPIEAGATYVFDLGYYDYGWWARLDAEDCRIVTRFKKNTPLSVIEELPLPEDPPADSNILSDRIGLLPRRQARSRKNPFAGPVREVRVKTDNDKILRILSNDLDATAQQIADLYKRRWDIELFFRWVKQTLKIKHFIGRTENAVRIQIAVALIAFLLLNLARAAQNAVKSPLAFARLVRTNLILRKRIDELIRPEKTTTAQSNQLSLLHAEI